jgi:uncharacterized protein YjbJ (UPF0337 family)
LHAARRFLCGTERDAGCFLNTPTPSKGDTQMDKDRINGAADQAKGAIKETAGKVTGDTKLKVEGAIDKATGKVESAMGKARDDIRDEASKS